MGSGGRPPLFETVEQLEKSIADYFEYIKGETEEKEIDIPKKDRKSGGPKAQKEMFTQVVRPPEPPTITGLALFLGFASRQSFYDYEKDGLFSYAIKRARLKIESQYEKALHYNNPTGAIFALKNFGWSDKLEIDQNTKHSGSVNHTIDHSKLSDATLREIAEAGKSEESQD